MTDILSEPEWIDEGPGDAAPTLILAHGAGQAMDSEFMGVMAARVAAAGIRVVRFNFPYMTRARREGRRRPPDREAVLLASWRRIIDAHGRDGCFVGGKSLGGRMASLVAPETGAAGLVCLGYPFHPPGRPDRLRIEHLKSIRLPTLICQGTRDPFGRPEEVAGYPLSKQVRLFWVEDGEHSFKPRKASGRSWAQNLEEAADAVVAFIQEAAAQS